MAARLCEGHPEFREHREALLAANEAGLFGIFGQIGVSGFFPPREFLNEFLMRGSDPCDQDGRMGDWEPLALSPEEYRAIKAW